MTDQEAIIVTAEIAATFPQLRGPALENIGLSIADYPAAVVRAELSQQHRTRRFFDLDVMLRACRNAQRVQRSVAVDLAAESRQRLATSAAARAAKEAQATLVDSLGDDELRAIADEVIAKQVSPQLAAGLRRRDPRTDLVFRLLIVAHLERRPAAAGVPA